MQVKVRAFDADRKNLSALSSAWQMLEARAKPNMFLSWSWIGTLLSQTLQRVVVTEATENGKVIGIGLWFESYTGVCKAKKLSLHKTGISSHDQVWIEYNDFLLDPSFSEKTRAALVAFAVNQLTWDILEIGPAQSRLISLFETYDIQQKIVWSAPSFSAQLNKQDTLDNYLLSLSKNVRSQIRRDLSEASNSLTVDVAKTEDECKKWFSDAATSHIERWRDTTSGSGFSNKRFTDFHYALIEEGFRKGNISLLRFKHNDTIFAHFYYFVDNKNVRFYLSSINYNIQLPFKNLGLLLHAKAIQFFLQQGAEKYDFMGGNAQYKRSLSHCELRFETVVLSKKKMHNTINFWRSVLSTHLFRLRSITDRRYQELELVVTCSKKQQTLRQLSWGQWETIDNSSQNTSGGHQQEVGLISTKTASWQLVPGARHLHCISSPSEQVRELGRPSFGGYCIDGKVYFFSKCGKVTVLSTPKLFSINEVYLSTILGIPNVICHQILPTGDEKILCAFSGTHFAWQRDTKYLIAEIDLKTNSYCVFGSVSLNRKFKIVGMFSSK